MNIWVSARLPYAPNPPPLKTWSAGWKRAAYAVLIAGGVISAGYLLAAITGHGGLGHDYTSAQLNSGKGDFGTANVAIIGAAGSYIVGTCVLFALPWMPRDVNFRPGPVIATLTAFNAIGILGYAIGRALLA